MATGQSAVVVHPDMQSNTLNSGAFYVDATSFGVSIDQPGGLAALTKKDVQGGGPTHVRQNGCQSAINGVDSTPVLADVLVRSDVIRLFAGTTLPAPDTFPGSGIGSLIQVTAGSDGVDWVGGIAPSPMGTMVHLFNLDGGGNQINVIDVTAGGGVAVGPPCVTLGYREYIAFMSLGPGGYIVKGRGSGYFTQGANQLGGRFTKTVDATPTPIYRVPFGFLGAGIPGVAYTCDVTVGVTGGGGATYTWYDVRAAYDDANVNYVNAAPGVPLVAVQGGNAAGVALAATLTIADAGGFHELVGTSPGGGLLSWHVNNWRSCALTLSA